MKRPLSFKKQLQIPDYINATQLFALAVTVMIFGHFLYFFIDNAHYTRIPDRILAPIFLIAVGYNAGHKLSDYIIYGAFALVLVEFFVTGQIHGSILLTIVLVRLCIEPLAKLMLQSATWLWSLSLCFIFLYLLTGQFLEYSFIAVILAFAGWLRKNEQALDIKTVKSSTYFIFALFAYVFTIQFGFNFNIPTLMLIGLGTTIPFYLMYNMKTLLMNAIRWKPQGQFGKAVKWAGHKSLEIYLAHMILFYIIYYIINL